MELYPLYPNSGSYITTRKYLPSNQYVYIQGNSGNRTTFLPQNSLPNGISALPYSPIFEQQISFTYNPSADCSIPGAPGAPAPARVPVSGSYTVEETVGILIGLAIIIIDYSQNSSIIYSVSLNNFFNRLYTNTIRDTLLHDEKNLLDDTKF